MLLLPTLRETVDSGGGSGVSFIILGTFLLMSTRIVESGTINLVADEDTGTERPFTSLDLVLDESSGYGSNQTRNPDGYISLEELSWLTDHINRENASFGLDLVPAKQSGTVPACSKSGYVYDPNADACAKPGTKAHCGENMEYGRSHNETIGGCRCSPRWQLCWGRPFVLVGDRCDQVATQGSCTEGQTIVAVDRYKVECKADACLGGALPKNAINFSKVAREWRDSQHFHPEENNEPFLFTHKDECYLTETEAFCEPGKVARFLRPYKSPFCVPRDHCRCDYWETRAGSAPVKAGQCGQGLVEDPVRSVCVTFTGLDFE